MVKKIVLALFYSILLLFLINKLTDPDLWWHLRSGQYIMDNGVIPKADVFSYTASGREWIDLHWLFQAVIYSFYKYAGPDSVILLQALVMTAVFSIFFWLRFESRNLLFTVIVFLAAVLACQERFLVRPEMFTLLFIGLYIYILDRYKDSKKDYLWFLPVLQALWVNMQGLFVLGPLMIFAYLLGEVFSWKLRNYFDYDDKNIVGDNRHPKLLLIACLCLGACFINPYGYKGALFPYELFGKIGPQGGGYSRDIFEFQRPFSIHPAGLDIQMYKALLFVSLFSFLAAFRRIRLSMFFVYLLFLYLSLLARRNINFFALAAAMLTADNLKNLSLKYGLEKKLSWLYPPLIAGMLLLSAGIATNRFYLQTNSVKRTGLGISSLLYSGKACDFVKESAVSGNIFNDLGSGGYLIWRLFPYKKVFIDGRLEVYDREFYDYYNSLFFIYPLFKQAVERYNINCVMWNYNLPFMPGEFLGNLVKDPNWKLACIDNSFIVFLRNSPLNREILASGLKDYTTELVSPHLGHEWRGVFFSQVLGLSRQAEIEYLRAVKINPGSFIARNNLGNIYIAKGLYGRAIKELESAITLKPDNAGMYVNLGIAYSALGEYGLAAKTFRKGLLVSKEMPQLWFNLGFAYEKRGDKQKAAVCYRKALKLNPDYANPKEQLERILNGNR